MKRVSQNLCARRDKAAPVTTILSGLLGVIHICRNQLLIVAAQVGGLKPLRRNYWGSILALSERVVKPGALLEVVHQADESAFYPLPQIIQESINQMSYAIISSHMKNVHS